jgi:CBS-domain-containing membrane protein
VDRAAYLDEQLTIAQLMQKPVATLKTTAGVAVAAELMIDVGVHAVPVVDDGDHVIGIVTTSDVIRSLPHGPPRKGVLPGGLLEKVLELADRFLRTGQDEHTHALLLKAIHAAKRAEEHAAGEARVPFPLE